MGGFHAAGFRTVRPDLVTPGLFPRAESHPTFAQKIQVAPCFFPVGVRCRNPGAAPVLFFYQGRFLLMSRRLQSGKHSRSPDSFPGRFDREADEAAQARTVPRFLCHECRVGNVDSHFNDRCGNQDICFFIAKILHDVFFFLIGKPTVKNGQFEIFKFSL